MKRDCKAVRPLLGAFHDNELDAAAAERVRQHVATCTGCRHELAGLEHLTGLVRRTGPPELADDYWDWHNTRVLRRLRQDSRQRQHFYRPSFLWPRLATLGGALVVVLVVATVGWQTIGPGLFKSQTVSQREQPAPVPALGLTTGKAAPVRRAEQPETVIIELAGSAGERAREGAQSEAVVAKRAPARPEADRIEAASRAPEPPPPPVAEKAVAQDEPARRPVVKDAEFKAAARSAGKRLEELVVHGARAIVPAAEQRAEPEMVEAPPLPRLDDDDTGMVLLKIMTDSLGRVLSALISQSSGSPRLDSAAVRNARHARFKVSKPDEKQHSTSFEFPYRFKPTLRKSKPKPQQE
jgi:TonB family protein